MITVSITNIFALYIFIIVSVIIIITLFDRSKANVLVEDRSLFNCPVCAFRYVTNITEKIHRCPQCGSLNVHKDADKNLRPKKGELYG